LDAADHLELAFIDGFLGLSPVDGGDVVTVFLRRSDLKLASGALGVIAGPECPTFARPLAGVAEVPVERWREDLEADAQLTRLRIALHARNHAVVLRRVLFNWRIRALRQRHREARRGQNVLGVWRHERSAMKAGDVRNRPENLFSFEI